jgi:hypothetical protein
VGTKTSVDVLDSISQLYSQQRNFARSRYDYILNMLQLKQLAGTLGMKDVEQVNSWLAKTAMAEPPPPTADDKPVPEPAPEALIPHTTVTPEETPAPVETPPAATVPESPTPDIIVPRSTEPDNTDPATAPI